MATWIGEFTLKNTIYHYLIPLWGIIRAAQVPTELKRQGLGDVSRIGLMAIACVHEVAKVIPLFLAAWAILVNNSDMNRDMEQGLQGIQFMLIVAAVYFGVSFVERLAIDGVHIPGKSGN